MEGPAIVWAQRLGLHAAAVLLIRRRLRRRRHRRGEREALLYRLALSLDALGRRDEAAACYAQAMDSALAPLLAAAGAAPARDPPSPSTGAAY